MSLFMIVSGVLALALGMWIGVGAPGWPHKENRGPRRRLEKRPLNPIAWGRTGTERRGSHRRRSSR